MQHCPHDFGGRGRCQWLRRREILRLLLGHPGYADGSLTIGALTAAASAGTRIFDHHPHLLPLADRVLEPTEPGCSAAMTWCSGAAAWTSAALAEELGPDTVVIDCGADFRLTDPGAWRRFWIRARRELAHGLPELPGGRDALAGATGSRCRAVIRPRPAGAVARTGRQPRRARRHGGGGQRHLGPAVRRRSTCWPPGHRIGTGVQHRRRAPAPPEIARGLSAVAGQPVTVSFTPVLIPTARESGHLHRRHRRLAPGDPRAYEKAYNDEPFVHLLADGQLPAPVR